MEKSKRNQEVTKKVGEILIDQPDYMGKRYLQDEADNETEHPLVKADRMRSDKKLLQNYYKHKEEYKDHHIMKNYLGP